MADSLEAAEVDQAAKPPVQEVNAQSDDEQDVHYCGRCKMSFTDLSEYIKHKANKLCRDILNKSSLTEVVEKLPLDGNQSRSEKSKGQNNDATNDVSTDATQKTPEDTETIDEGSSAKRVEVQFLDPVAAGDSESVQLSVGDEQAAEKAVDNAKSAKPSKRHKRKNSHPKTTRKRKSSSSTQTANQEKGKEPRSKKTASAVTVHIPESQLVHLTSGSTASPSSNPQGSGVRKQGATSVFVPIYLNPPSKVYKCQRCPASFSNLTEKEEHNKMHKKEFKCSLCSKSFFTANGFEQHRLNESHSHPCGDCGKVFTSTVQLKKHKTTHSTDRPFLCDECDKTFCSSANLRSHKRTVHATEKKHKCPECGKAFARKDKMKRHSLIHYPDTRPTFTCPFRSHTGCMKTFYRDDKLKRHLFTHSKDKPFKCEQCNKGYARRDNLNDHMRIHTGNYSHNCQLCDKGFLGPHKLKKHMRSAHRETLSREAAANPIENHPPTMVTLDAASRAALAERMTPAPSSEAARSSRDDETLPSSPEEHSHCGDEEAFDVSGSETGDELTSEEEGMVNKGQSASKTPQTNPQPNPQPAPQPAPQLAPSRAPASAPAAPHPPRPPHPPHPPPLTPHPPPLTPGPPGPLPRMRPVPRVSASPQPFIPPPLPPGLHATAELMAFTQELFNVVGRFQS